MKVKSLVLVLSALFFSNAWADMFCPNNFNSINLGDSIDSVIAACGKPDSKTTNNKKANQPQEWTYYVSAATATNQPGSTQPGTMKLTVAFDGDGKAINISVNGSGMPQTKACPNGEIQLGDSLDAVEAACGKATYVNQTQTAQGATVPEIEMVDLVYNGSPSVTLHFENGKLTQRK
jgi:hypothetical protein